MAALRLVPRHRSLPVAGRGRSTCQQHHKQQQHKPCAHCAGLLHSKCKCMLPHIVPDGKQEQPVPPTLMLRPFRKSALPPPAVGKSPTQVRL